ncbi:MAG: T9SS type A sorting domain-containing protein [Chlorobi bacterium]|nr:T9SS type A sorting domain-containing protein [Chlorobiota bacterium]MBX7217655.1 T9SS type A sorting domain-containing protein [Candidatus Kapabacteria bacterium]
MTGTCQTTTPSGGGAQVTGGYISVGYSTWEEDSSNPNDVYVVRTDNNGNKIWENTYDIGGANGIDAGRSLIELSDNTGFMITGITDLGTGNFDIFLMKIDCDGGVLWTRTYGGAQEEQAMDIAEARYATNVTIGTRTYYPFVGDVYVVGWTKSLNTNPMGQPLQEALMMRLHTRAGVEGLPVWTRSYNETPSVPYTTLFNAVTDLTQYTITGQGVVLEDVMAVGILNDPATYGAEGYVVRVDGNSGLSTWPFSHGSAYYGKKRTLNCTSPPTLSNGAEVFTSVAELPGPPSGSLQGDVVVGGYTTTYDTANVNRDIYLVGLRQAVPWLDYTQTRLGDGTACEQYDDYAWSLRYIPAGIDSTDTLFTGHLAVTGATNKSNQNNDWDAFLITVNPTTLLIGAGDITMKYGLNQKASQHEEGVSVFPVTSAGNRGFIIAGGSQSDPACANPDDPQDLYLVKTDQSGNSGVCDDNYQILGETISTWSPSGNSLVTTWVAWYREDSAVAVDHDWGEDACTGCTPKRMIEGSNDGEENVLLPTPMKIANTIRSFPNPVRKGSTVTVVMSAEEEEVLNIRVLNSLGEQVREERVSGTGRTPVTIETEGLPAGTYIISVGSRAQSQTIRLVVVE